MAAMACGLGFMLKCAGLVCGAGFVIITNQHVKSMCIISTTMQRYCNVDFADKISRLGGAIPNRETPRIA